jgi:hypothetical protein
MIEELNGDKPDCNMTTSSGTNIPNDFIQGAIAGSKYFNAVTSDHH